MKLPFILLIGLLFASCNSGRYYANYRAGGNADETRFDQPYDEKKSETANEKEIDLIPETVVPFGSPEEIIKEENKKPNNPITAPASIKEERENRITENRLTTPSSDTIVTEDSAFVLDELLVMSYSAASINYLGAITGFITLSNQSMLYISVPFYTIFMPVASIVGVCTFFIALALIAAHKIDPRNGKYFWIWIPVFGLSVALALIPLFLFI